MTTSAAMRPDWPQVKLLFEEALALPAEQRAGFLLAVTADAAVRSEVESLLTHLDAAADDAPLSIAMRDLGSHTDSPGLATAEPLEGQRLGAWTVMAALGQGGMGEVYRARRSDGAYEGQAAIKVLKRGMDSAALLARFGQEQRVLARLNHPHIARLFDAGITADQRPYFVMELVEGQAIDQAAQGLTLEQRLALFLQLADAVAYAHRQLLVHRDLKPGNVLVDGQGQVKLLDFGIAKALEDNAADATMTQQGQRPFTPNYASPEQVRGEPVGTGTDIYSLGVLLYQLLTGLRPYGRDATTPHAAARCVLEEAPTKPSSLPAASSADPQWLATRRRLAGDLDNILLKALEKPLERRYPSVDALAADLRAYLGGFPVSARAASWHYVAGRFMGRNRTAAAIAAVGALGILVSLVAALWQAHRADQARALAERRFADVRQLANALVFKYHDKIANLPGSIATRDALLGDALHYLDSLRGDGNATLDAGLARELAESYFRIALLQGEQFSPSQERLADAQANLEKAIALLPHYIEAPAQPVEALHDAAKIWITRHTQLVRAGRLAASLEPLEQARSVIVRAARMDPANLETLSLQATLEGRVGLVQGGSATSANLGRIEPALEALRRSEALMAQLAAREPANAQWVHQHAWACQNLATVYSLTGRANEALTWARKGTALRDAAAEREPGDPHYLQARATARLLQSRPASDLGLHDEALALADSGMALARRALANDPQNKVAERDLALGHLARARALASASRAAEARAALDQALPRLAPPAGEVALDFYLARMRAEALIWYARVLPAQEAAAALAAAREAASLMAPASGTAQDENAARAWCRALALGEVAAALAVAGDTAAARSAAAQALAAWRASPGGRAPGLYAVQQARIEALAAAAPQP